MKRFKVLVCLIMVNVPTFAEGISRQAGDRSLNFSFSDFAVEDYKYGIGGKYWLSSNSAVTASVNVRKSKQETETTTIGPPVTDSSDSESYGFTVGIENHFHSKTDLSPYVGGEVLYMNNELEVAGSNLTGKTWGVNVILGAEYAFSDSIALAAEYAYGYSRQDNETTSSSGKSSTTSEGFYLNSSKLILLLYF